jgi:hypothetical protein
MQRNIWKKIYDAVSYPKGWVFMLVYATTLTAVAVSVAALATDNGLTAFAFTMYAVSVLFAVYSVFITVKLYHTMRGKVLNVADRYAFTRKLHKDYSFRTLIFGACALALDIVFVLFLFITAIKAKTFWYWTLVGYYILIAIVRGGVLIRNTQMEKRHKDNFINLQLGKIRIYRYCGAIFLLLAFVLLISVVQMLTDGSRFPSPSGMIYAFGCYAIYRSVTSLYRLIKTKKLEDLSASALQNINFITALVVLLTFQTVLLDTLTATLSWLFNGISGLALCVLVLIFGIYMLQRGKRAETNMQNRLKKGE